MDYTELVKGLREHAERFNYEGWIDTAIWFEQAADAIEQSADVVPVRHGRWEDTLFGWLCTACREEQQYTLRLRYCPNCGAKMDGEA